MNEEEFREKQLEKLDTIIEKLESIESELGFIELNTDETQDEVSRLKRELQD